MEDATVRVSRFGAIVDLDPSALGPPAYSTQAADHFLFLAAEGTLFATERTGDLYQFDPVSASLRTFSIDGDLSGLALSPDEQSIYIGQLDEVRDPVTLVPTMTVHKFDRQSETVTDLTFEGDRSDDGVFDIAFANTGIGFINTEFTGSGSNPLRQIDADSDQIEDRIYESDNVRGEISPAFLTPSEDNRFILFEELVSSDRLGLYDEQLDDWIARIDEVDLEGISGFNSGRSDIHAGKQLIVVSGYDLVFDFDFSVVTDLRDQDFSDYAFSDDGSILYALIDGPGGSIGPNGSIVALDTTTWVEIAQYDLRDLLPEFDSGTSGSSITRLSSESSDGILILDTDDGFATLDIGALTSAVEITGTTARDFLIGSDAFEIISGGDGPDKVLGGSGRDIFIADAVFRDKIMDFELGLDRIDLSDWNVGALSDLTIIQRSPSSLLLIANESSIVVEAKDRDALAVSDLGVHNLILGPVDNPPREIFGTPGDDRLIGNAADNVLFGDTGRDVFSGKAGADQFWVVGDDSRDKIIDFMSEDIIVLTNWGIQSFDDLSIKQRNNESVLIYTRDHSVVVQSADAISVDDLGVENVFLTEITL